VFAFCYARIFHTVRRQSKVVTGHAGHGQIIAMATIPHDQNAEVQQQATGATTGNKLSRTEMNILKTMITVVACFMLCWTVPAITNFLQLLGVGIHILMGSNGYIIGTIFMYYFYLYFSDFSVDRTSVLTQLHMRKLERTFCR